MTTTFEKFANTIRGNYCRLPTIDVEIIESPAVCDTCEKSIRYDPKAHTFGGYVHDDGPNGHAASVRLTCSYCGTNGKGVVVSHQRAWSDDVECARCGGVRGYAIGD